MPRVRIQKKDKFNPYQTGYNKGFLDGEKVISKRYQRDKYQWEKSKDLFLEKEEEMEGEINYEFNRNRKLANLITYEEGDKQIKSEDLIDSLYEEINSIHKHNLNLKYELQRCRDRIDLMEFDFKIPPEDQYF